MRGLQESECTDEDALMSEMLESDALTREAQKKQFGCDPLDVEAMLAVSFPRQ